VCVQSGVATDFSVIEHSVGTLLSQGNSESKGKVRLYVVWKLITAQYKINVKLFVYL